MFEGDLLELLRAGLEAKQGTSSALAMSEKDQIKRLSNFNERKVDFKVGERVVRNEDGENRYRFPRKDQVAVITTVFDHPQTDKDGSVVHGEIGMVVRKPNSEETTILSYTVDFRYYKRRPSLAAV